MFYALHVRDKNKTPVPHWPKVKFLKTKQVIEFKPGLNVIYGKNGTGKSTLISALAMLSHTYDENWPIVSAHSLMRFNRPNGLSTGLFLEHDGSPARYMGTEPPAIAPTKGVIAQDLLLKLLPGSRGKARKNMSHGQATIASLVPFLKAKPSRVKYEMTAVKATGEWQDLFAVGAESVSSSYPRKGVKKQQTILLDEVDRSLDFAAQCAVWKQVSALAQDNQVIIASHSPWAAAMKNAHYIETSEGYLADTRTALRKLTELMVKL